MKLTASHIAYRFLVDDSFAWELVETMHPKINRIDVTDMSKIDPYLQRAAQTYGILRANDQKAYYITESVMNKLDMLKVTKSKVMPIRKQDSSEIVGEVKTFDWTVFNNTPNIMRPGGHRKYTFILPGNKLVRLQTSNGFMAFFYLWVNEADKNKTFGQVGWCMFWNNIHKEEVCDHWTHQDVQRVEELIFKLLCFIYLSENEEQVVMPGGKHGTRKSGKIINELPIPVTTVTSKWNITSIRTEGFDVSGHLRLQPTRSGTRMIFIQPFKKHGYVRRSKSNMIN